MISRVVRSVQACSSDGESASRLRRASAWSKRAEALYGELAARRHGLIGKQAVQPWLFLSLKRAGVVRGRCDWLKQRTPRPINALSRIRGGIYRQMDCIIAPARETAHHSARGSCQSCNAFQPQSAPTNLNFLLHCSCAGVTTGAVGEGDTCGGAGRRSG